VQGPAALATQGLLGPAALATQGLLGPKTGTSIAQVQQIAEKTAHHVAECFQITERGYIREGYWADLAIVDMQTPYTVSKSNIEYQCGWSPLEGHTFPHSISHTFVSGHLAYQTGKFDESKKGERLLFTR
jgi:dihydroorotase